MAEKNEVFEVIKSVITSQKGGVMLKDINRDYRNLAGENIPYKSLGYHSIEEVLGDIPEVYSYVNADGELVFINEGKNCEHLVELISKQKTSKNNKLQLCKKGFRQNPSQLRVSAVGNKVHRRPCSIAECDYSTKPCPDFYESGHKGSTLKERNERSHDNDTTCTVKRSVGSRRDLKEKKATSSVERIYNASLKHESGSYSRKSEAHFHTDYLAQRGRTWKPNDHCDELPLPEHWQKFNTPMPQENCVYPYKSSTFLDKRESSHGAKYKHDPRDYRQYQPCITESLEKFKYTFPVYEENMDSELTNFYSTLGIYNRGEKYASSSRPMNFRSTRVNHTKDFPNPLYRDDDFDSPVGRNHHSYSGIPKYRSSRHVPEIDDWDIGTHHNDKYDANSEVNGNLWMEKNDTSGHSSRKIDIISGSLRVTIKNC